ncbi:hypothetical protein [Microbulbifer sp.]|uniref:hypothetical protein n=1 Tax=Microbulbifer sp. TaxID=1908541 RepID=UPI0025881272|nr:hypothetical protein [Microbulbifer sp.]
MKVTRKITVAALVGLAALIFVARELFFTYVDERYRQSHDNHQYEVVFNNSLNHGYIWISHRVIVHIWDENSDASYDPEQSIIGTLELYTQKSYTGFVLSGQSSSLGKLTLPAHFQLNEYIRNRNKITFSVHLLVNDIYAGEDFFIPSPQQNFDAAFFTVETRIAPEFSEILFNYPRGS